MIIKVKNDYLERITLVTKKKRPQYVIKGTMISVAHLFELLAGGCAIQALLQEYPQLTQEDMQACFAYAQDLIESEEYPCDIPF